MNIWHQMEDNKQAKQGPVEPNLMDNVKTEHEKDLSQQKVEISEDKIDLKHNMNTWHHAGDTKVKQDPDEENLMDEEDFNKQFFMKCEPDSELGLNVKTEESENQNEDSVHVNKGTPRPYKCVQYMDPEHSIMVENVKAFQETFQIKLQPNEYIEHESMKKEDLRSQIEAGIHLTYNMNVGNQMEDNKQVKQEPGEPNLMDNVKTEDEKVLSQQKVEISEDKIDLKQYMNTCHHADDTKVTTEPEEKIPLDEGDFNEQFFVTSEPDAELGLNVKTEDSEDQNEDSVHVNKGTLRPYKCVQCEQNFMDNVKIEDEKVLCQQKVEISEEKIDLKHNMNTCHHAGDAKVKLEPEEENLMDEGDFNMFKEEFCGKSELGLNVKTEDANESVRVNMVNEGTLSVTEHFN